MRGFNAKIKIAKEGKRLDMPEIGIIIAIISTVTIVLSFIIIPNTESYKTLKVLSFMMLVPVSAIAFVSWVIKSAKHRMALITGTLYVNMQEDLFIFKSWRGETLVFRLSTFLGNGSKRHYKRLMGAVPRDRYEYTLTNSSVRVNYNGNIRQCSIFIKVDDAEILNNVLTSIGYAPTSKSCIDLDGD